MAGKSYKDRELNDQQRLFCRKYAHLNKGLQAAVEAGYSPRNAASQASKLLKRPKIVALIAKIKSAQTREDSAFEAANEERILQELEHVGFHNVARAFDKDGKLKAVVDWPESLARAVATIKITQVGDGKATVADVRFLDKQTALKMLGQQRGMFKEQHEHVHRLKGMSDEELAAEALRVDEQLSQVRQMGEDHGVRLDS